jgi:serine/threonine protein kinase
MEIKIGDVIELREITGQKCIVTKIVEGGAGKVYFLKTTSLFFMPEIVMKIMKDKTDIENSFREARLWSKIGHHKNIASYLFCGLFDEKFYILSCRYKNSLESICKIRKIDDTVIKKLTIGIISGLDYANKQVGLIHRDIKPHNIFIDDDCEPKIGDFGLSSYIKNRHILSSDFNDIYTKLTISSQLGMGGTIPYMAPELFSTNPNYSISSDIFALGVTLFNLVTNMGFPYNLPEFTINPDSIYLFQNSNISSKMKNIILNCINTDGNKRYKTYNEITNEMDVEYNEIYIPVLRDYIDNIQTLRRTKQYSEARLKLDDALQIFNKSPLLINQLAILEKEEKGIEYSIKIYEGLFENNIDYDFNEYLECFFNLVGFYSETKQFNKIVPFVSKFENEFTNIIFIEKEFIEYSIYLAFKKEYEKSFKNFKYYCSTHAYNDMHVIFFVILSVKLKRIEECIKIIEQKQSDITKQIINIYYNYSIDEFIDSVYNLENEYFGGI